MGEQDETEAETLAEGTESEVKTIWKQALEDEFDTTNHDPADVNVDSSERMTDHDDNVTGADTEASGSQTHSDEQPQSGQAQEQETTNELRERVNELETQLAEKSERIHELEYVESSLEDIDGTVNTLEYIERLEAEIKQLREKTHRKSRTIDELKDDMSDIKAEARKEAEEELVVQFFENVREPLARGINQYEDVPQGLKLTLDKFDEVLRDLDRDVAVIEPEVGAQYNYHEYSIAYTTESEHEKGTVIGVSSRGLKVDGKQVSEPEVGVSSGPPEKPEEQESESESSETIAEDHREQPGQEKVGQKGKTGGIAEPEKADKPSTDKTQQDDRDTERTTDATDSTGVADTFDTESWVESDGEEKTGDNSLE